MSTRHIINFSELQEIAQEILSVCTLKDSAAVIALSGDLGAGKTALVKELAKILGIPQEITSPTFVIMKSYPLHADTPFKTLVHIDAYRIESDDEMRVLDFASILKDPENIICIEWPEKIQNLIPQHATLVTITLNTDGTREVTYSN